MILFTALPLAPPVHMPTIQGRPFVEPASYPPMLESVLSFLNISLSDTDRTDSYDIYASESPTTEDELSSYLPVVIHPDDSINHQAGVLPTIDKAFNDTERNLLPNKSAPHQNFTFFNSSSGNYPNILPT